MVSGPAPSAPEEKSWVHACIDCSAEVKYHQGCASTSVRSVSTIGMLQGDRYPLFYTLHQGLRLCKSAWSSWLKAFTNVLPKSAGLWVVGQLKPADDRKGTSCWVVPWNTHRPCDTTYTWSNSWNSDAAGWWIVHTIVRPCLARVRNSSSTCLAVTLSSPLQSSTLLGFYSNDIEGYWFLECDVMHCMYVRIYTYVRVCIYIYIYIYTHIHIRIY